MVIVFFCKNVNGSHTKKYIIALNPNNIVIYELF